MKVLVTGGAGFIGSNMCQYLLDAGHEVLAIDNFLLGKRSFITPFLKNHQFKFFEADLCNLHQIEGFFSEVDTVVHLAANSDISLGAKKTDTDLQLGTILTYNVLEAMRKHGVKRILFASSSAIYGKATLRPTPESYGPLLPISLYGASKLACEALVSAFSYNYGIQAWIFRFANIVGKNGTHGAVIDFIHKLRHTPGELKVLGNGQQSKPYLHVSDCISGMWHSFYKASEQVNLVNLSTHGNTSVRFIAEEVARIMQLSPRFVYDLQEEGWKGDVTQVELDPTRIEALGWKPRFTSNEAVQQAITELLQQL